MANANEDNSQEQISNADITKALREMALFLEMDDVPFKPQAYEKAAIAVSGLDRPIADLYREGGESALDAIPGVGKGIARRIAAMILTGKMPDLEELREKTPVDVIELTAIEGIGPKKARALWEALGVQSVEDLQRAADKGSIRELPHFGVRSEQRILDALALHQETAGRRPLGEVLGLARSIEAALAELPGVVHAAVAGSIRRHRDTIGDLDLLVACDSPKRGERVSKAFAELPEVQTVLARGPTKTRVRLSNGIDADLRVLEPDSFGAALQYFTGSKAHNVALRKIAQSNGLKLNEYGVFRGKRSIAGRTEEEVYRALDLSWVPPELREDTGEIELAARDELPELIEAGDIRGDLRVRSDWGEGSASIEAMARAAKKLGREYIVISDRTRAASDTGGLDRAQLRAQIEAIRRLDRKLHGIRVLAGVELDIRPDGSLDIDDDLLAELDLVAAGVNSHFDQTREQMTQRLVRAIENPHVDLLCHPLGRVLGRRRAVHLEFDALLEACLRMGTILEINAQPDRLDLPDTQVRRAVQAGARLAICSNAHAVDELGLIETLGLGVARRGWAEPEHIVNSLPLEGLLRMVEARQFEQLRATAQG